MIRMFNPNAMLPIYDYKQNKVYMINVTTQKFYYQPQKFKPINTTMIIAAGAIIGGSLYRVIRLWRQHLYLNDPSQFFRISLVITGVATGVSLSLLLWLLIRKKYMPQFEEYSKSMPHPKEVKNADDIKKILGIAQTQALLSTLVSIGLLFWSISLFNRFLDEANLEAYTLATILFLSSSALFSRMDHTVFILKLTTKMNRNKQSLWWLFKNEPRDKY